ncbi:MAG: PqqD family protein [Candidatus Electryonea clarkiae]|nr:PqqD family protein [Candidatus Electryonea clarkiae]MDP8288968.1 PqqD family protein [Candidatus Electryonea clarkiae]
MDVHRSVSGVISQEVDEGLLLLRDDGQYILLNQTAEKVWKGLENFNSEEELARILSSEDGSPKYEVCLGHVKTLLSGLILSGFIEKDNDTPRHR